ncbi:MAG: hypothetical protein FWG14_12215 [Peptococcaceae bacterium]|nr:hypothetical protein [Peptococcaceae bacterium]
MFEYIFECYKNDIYDEFYLKKKKTWMERLMSDHPILGWLILVIVIVLIMVGMRLTISLNWTLGLLLILPFASEVYTAHVMRGGRKALHSRFNEYLELRIEPLTILLKGDRYNLHNNISIEWLIECCDDMTGDKLKKSPFQASFQLFLPVITLVFGALLAKMDLNTLVEIAGGIILFVLYAYAYRNVKDMSLGRDGRLTRALKADLQFIKTQLPEVSEKHGGLVSKIDVDEVDKITN